MMCIIAFIAGAVIGAVALAICTAVRNWKE
jgi:hypothetical protein